MTDSIDRFISETEKQISEIKKQISYISFARIFFFIVFAIETYRGFGYNILFEKISSILSLLFFIILIFSLNTILKKNQFLENIIKICFEIKNQKSQSEDLFEDIDLNHAFSYDLDIFGRKSLFEKINRCQTFFGKEILISFLKYPLLSHVDIENRQNAIKELSSKLEWNIKFLAKIKFKDLNVLNISVVKKWIENDFNKFNPTYIKLVLVIGPLLNLLFLIFLLIFQLPAKLILIPILVSFTIGKIYRKQIKEIYTTIDIKSNELKKIKATLELIENESFTSINNKNLQEKLVGYNNVKASQSIKNLSQLFDAFENRNNLLMSSILNILFLWDLQYTYRIQKYIHENKKFIPDWFNVIGEFEALISFGLFAYQNPAFIYPLRNENNNVLNAKGLSHPLLSTELSISNNLHVNHTNTISIITGANMSGKSTFLRTVGVNMVLAMNGCPVCATSFTFYPVSIFTSMRTNDSLSDGSSYFNAEIKRLKLLIDKLENGEPQFIILDEILKGTNSTDKLKGSQLFLERIIKMKTFNTCLIATHDLELTKMQSDYPDNIMNYCFELHKEGNLLQPDYILNNGVTQNMNAIQLMKELNII